MRGMATRPLLTHGQAAYILCLSPSTLSDWVRRGKLIPAETTPGGHRRYLPEDVHRLARVEGTAKHRHTVTEPTRLPLAPVMRSSHQIL
jgi:predicted site-specific integrase-resolvase